MYPVVCLAWFVVNSIPRATIRIRLDNPAKHTKQKKEYFKRNLYRFCINKLLKRR